MPVFLKRKIWTSFKIIGTSFALIKTLTFNEHSPE